MKTYKVIFSCASALNEIPDSQTIFGAICSILLQTKGEEALNVYLKSLQNQPKMIHSSMFLNGTVPMVKKNLFSIDAINQTIQDADKKDKLGQFQDIKKYKKITKLSEKIYERYILTDRFDELKQALHENEADFKIENGILSLSSEEILGDSKSTILVRNGFPDKTEDKTLFYAKTYYFDKDCEFCIYVKTDESEAYIRDIFQYFEVFGIGNRRSVGMNVFSLKRIEPVSYESSSIHKLLLSRYIPHGDEVDYEQSYYGLEERIYRSSKEYAHGEMNGIYRHLVEGSWLKMKDSKEVYGKVVEASAGYQSIYHYALGFVL